MTESDYANRARAEIAHSLAVVAATEKVWAATEKVWREQESKAAHADLTLKTLPQMQAEAYQQELDSGWAGPGAPERSFGDSMALLHSEVSEAFEAYRDWGLADQTKGDLNPPSMPLSKPEGVGSEFADIFIRLLTDCQRWNVDLQWEYDRKMAYNHTRSYRHGGKRL